MYTADEKKMADFFVEREGEGILEELRDIDFFDAGILDSLDMVTLAVFVEKVFGKKLNLYDNDTFKSVRRFDTLMSLIMGQGKK